MSILSWLYRVLFCISLFLISSSQVIASKTTWIGTLPGGDWSVPSNWDNGVPTISDSAIIIGGNAIIKMNVLISSSTEAGYIFIDEDCILTIAPLISLNVVGIPCPISFPNPSFCIIVQGIENKGSLLNYGTANISNVDNGILLSGNFENYGEFTINAASDNGILIAKMLFYLETKGMVS